MNLKVILGTRPEVIKLAPVIREARARGHLVEVLTTGQHGHLVTPLLNFFALSADVDLQVMRPDQGLPGLSARVLERLEERAGPADCVLVQGDTTSAAMGAYWAFCRRIPVAHVEAGLRTRDLASPFPEEGNRQLIGRLASLHFAPTLQSATALHEERIDSARVRTVGNTAIDALLFALERISTGDVPGDQRLSPEVERFCERAGDELVLVTAHRRESYGEGFAGICEGIRKVVDARRAAHVIYPVHPNPNVRQVAYPMLGDHPRVLLCEPQPYGAFVALMGRARVLLTDSGGIQEEAPSLRKPIVVLRKCTERPEGVAAGFAKLVGTDPDLIAREALRALDDPSVPDAPNPYGDGRASMEIVRALEEHLE